RRPGADAQLRFPPRIQVAATAPAPILPRRFPRRVSPPRRGAVSSIFVIACLLEPVTLAILASRSKSFVADCPEEPPSKIDLTKARASSEAPRAETLSEAGLL